MLPPNFFRLALYALLWVIPALALWLYVLEPVLLPFFTMVDNWLLQTTFSRVRPELELINGTEWHIHTKIILEEQIDGKLRTWRLKVGNISGVSLGLPLLWAMLLAIPHYRIRNLLFGSLLLSGLIILALWLRASDNLVSQGQYFKVFVSTYIHLSLTWIPEVLNTAHLAFSYFAAFIAPPLLAFWLNKSWWRNTISQPHFESHQ